MIAVDFNFKVNTIICLVNEQFYIMWLIENSLLNGMITKTNLLNIKYFTKFKVYGGKFFLKI